jgi:hypothetical protein
VIGNGKVDGSYHPSKIQFSENTNLIQSVISALEAFKPHFDISVMDITVTETNLCTVKFRHNQGLTKTMVTLMDFMCILLSK